MTHEKDAPMDAVHHPAPNSAGYLAPAEPREHELADRDQAKLPRGDPSHGLVRTSTALQKVTNPRRINQLGHISIPLMLMWPGASGAVGFGTFYIAAAHIWVIASSSPNSPPESLHWHRFVTPRDLGVTRARHVSSNGRSSRRWAGPGLWGRDGRGPGFGAGDGWGPGFGAS